MGLDGVTTVAGPSGSAVIVVDSDAENTIVVAPGANAALTIDAEGDDPAAWTLENAARAINAHPGVSHNYLRDHAFNLWFTIAVPPDSALGLDGTLDVLARLYPAGVRDSKLVVPDPVHDAA